MKYISQFNAVIFVATLFCFVVISGCGEKSNRFKSREVDTSYTSNILAPVDDETTDKKDMTDMSIPIMEMLNQTGYCHLTAGTYFIRKGIDMPEGTTLDGCGNNTVIKLIDDVEKGYCIRISRYNTVSNIRFCGGYSEPDISSTKIGERNGMIFVANRDGKEESLPNVTTSIVNRCWFEYFDGSAIYGHNSGGGIHESLIVSDCVIHHCDAGINLDYYTEYHKFSSVIVHHCHYACINNGGNNTFVGCTFHGTIGFLIDNSKKDKYNTAHGSAIGCTFNHIDNWNHSDALGGGIAVGIYNTNNTFCFEGCQLWYGSIMIEDSKGIYFDGCTFGGNNPNIRVTDSSTAFFSDCIFHQIPDLEVGEETVFSGCHLDATGEEIR